MQTGALSGKKMASCHSIQTGGLNGHFTGIIEGACKLGAPTAFEQGSLGLLLLFEFGMLSMLELLKESDDHGPRVWICHWERPFWADVVAAPMQNE